MAFLNQTLINLDTNTVGSLTNSIDITNHSMFGWFVDAKSGSHDNHRIGLQVSLDNINWRSANSGLEGANVRSEQHDFPYGYIRFRVSKAEGSASEVDIVVNAK